MNTNILSAHSFHYDYGDSLITIDSVNQNRYSNLKSIWEVRVGYFPIVNDNFKSSGVSGSFFYESPISNTLNLGWIFQLNLALKDRGGYMSLGGFLSYPIKFNNHSLYLKSGLGFATTSSYPSPTVMFEVEYLLFEF